jgi:RimJ/RimL family protein N-acetyltransferase
MTVDYDDGMADENLVEGLGTISIREIDGDYPRPVSPSVYVEWGEMAPEVRDLVISRWLITLTQIDRTEVAVGDLSAHAVWYGPTPGSRALNIGISVVNQYRGKGIGAIAQRLLADELHRQGIVRVEAQTDIENFAEQKALENAGFKYEGTLRKAQARMDGLHDIQVWSHIFSGNTDAE